jgi:hypothetical protein
MPRRQPFQNGEDGITFVEFSRREGDKIPIVVGGLSSPAPSADVQITPNRSPRTAADSTPRQTTA